MRRHEWAAERLWQALLLQDDDTWIRGAAAFADDPLHGEAVPAGVAPLAKKVHELGAKAAETTDWDERGALYGEVLATCADCHSKVFADKGD